MLALRDLILLYQGDSLQIPSSVTYQRVKLGGYPDYGFIQLFGPLSHTAESGVWGHLKPFSEGIYIECISGILMQTCAQLTNLLFSIQGSKLGLSPFV